MKSRVDPRANATSRRLRSSIATAFIFIWGVGVCATQADLRREIELGQAIFNDKSLSRDGSVSCDTCHSPSIAYTDSRRTSVGVAGRAGTRNAPSLIGIGTDDSFFWDGRRTRLEDVVLDPFTNPAEFGLTSIEELVAKLRSSRRTMHSFRLAYPEPVDIPTIEQTQRALASFVRSLAPPPTAIERYGTLGSYSRTAALGRELFDGIAGCSECHVSTGASARFSDGGYHHSGVSQGSSIAKLTELVRSVIAEPPDADALGPKVLTDARWSALGRFLVSHNPADIGAYRTPSLLNVALTAPYMHDGSIATLPEAVDRELFYRGFSRGRPLNLSAEERAALVAFLQTLTTVPDPRKQ